MPVPSNATFQIVINLLPSFNLAATGQFIDPFRAANYLSGQKLYHWHLVSADGYSVLASNRMAVETEPLSSITAIPDLAMVSSSWTPEEYHEPRLIAALRRWTRFGAALGGIDTGAFVLAQAGLLKGRRATVHFEHIDAFRELYPGIDVSPDLYVVDKDRLSCAGGAAAAGLALQVLRNTQGTAIADAAADYIFHHRLHPAGVPQTMDRTEPFRATTRSAVCAAIQIMQLHVEEPLTIPAIAAEIGCSQRQLERLFRHDVQRSPQQYYRDIRLDRARGFVTQTDIPIWEIALLCGFSSPEHFTRAYRTRFGLAPRADRVQGRIPFEFRNWANQRPATGRGQHVDARHDQ